MISGGIHPPDSTSYLGCDRGDVTWWGDSDHVDRMVQLPVPARVQPMSCTPHGRYSSRRARIPGGCRFGPTDPQPDARPDGPRPPTTELVSDCRRWSGRASDPGDGYHRMGCESRTSRMWRRGPGSSTRRSRLGCIGDGVIDTSERRLGGLVHHSGRGVQTEFNEWKQRRGAERIRTCSARGPATPSVRSLRTKSRVSLPA